MFFRPLGDTARLEPLEVWQAEEFAAHMDRARKHIRPWVGPSFVTEDVDGARRTLQRYASAAAEDGARLFGIRADGRLIGGVMFVSFSAAAGGCEIGCWTEPAGEGRGYVTAASRVLVDWALDIRGLNRVEWRCRADNDRSAAVAQRLGMTLEGVLRGAWSYGGSFHDSQVWAILRSDRSRSDADSTSPTPRSSAG